MDLHRECIEKDIIDYLDQGKKVFIENGCLNDSIIGYEIKTHKTYSWQEYEEKEYVFTTSASVFPETIKLSDYEDYDCEVFQGNLFVSVL